MRKSKREGTHEEKKEKILAREIYIGKNQSREKYKWMVQKRERGDVDNQIRELIKVQTCLGDTVGSVMLATAIIQW